MAWSCARMLRRSLGPCSPSISSQSKPAPAQISALKVSPSPSHRPSSIWSFSRSALKRLKGMSMSAFSGCVVDDGARRSGTDGREGLFELGVGRAYMLGGKRMHSREIPAPGQAEGFFARLPVIAQGLREGRMAGLPVGAVALPIDIDDRVEFGDARQKAADFLG